MAVHDLLHGAGRQGGQEGDMILSFDARELMQRLQLKQSELDTGMKELERMRLQEQQTQEDAPCSGGREGQQAKGRAQSRLSRGLDRAHGAQKSKNGARTRRPAGETGGKPAGQPDLGDEEPDPYPGIQGQAAEGRGGTAAAGHPEDERPGSQAGASSSTRPIGTARKRPWATHAGWARTSSSCPTSAGCR